MATNSIKMNVVIEEESADNLRLNKLTNALIKDLRKIGVDDISRPEVPSQEEFSKGDEFTIGALLLVTTPVLLTQLFSFLQAWVGERRKVSIEANGVSLEFTPDKKLSDEDLLKLVKKIKKMSKS